MEQIFPTKGNLLSVKKSLELSTLGYDLLDRKRNILIRELMQLADSAKQLRREVARIFEEAYTALRNANMTLGQVTELTRSVPVETRVSITYRSVMGVEIPSVSLPPSEPSICYGFSDTNSHFDNAYICFLRVKEYAAVLAEMENSIYRLAVAVRKTQRRANALKNIVIPQFEEAAKFITDYLEEKEREEFSRLKVIKSSQEAASGGSEREAL